MGGGIASRALCVLLATAIIATSCCNGYIFTANAAGVSTAVHEADSDTSDSYASVLNLSANTQAGGKLWADKSVFTGDIMLDPETDGYTGTIKNTSDFLVESSILGSSVSVHGANPVKMVFVIDNSASMYSNSSTWEKTRIDIATKTLNKAIDQIMEANPYNEVAVVVFGDGAASVGDNVLASNVTMWHGNDTATTMIPMGHYVPQKDPTLGYTPYLSAGWRGKAAGSYIDGDNPIHDNTIATTNMGFIFVNHKHVPVNGKTTGYTGYVNSTTNVQAGLLQGFSVLLDGAKTVRVGIETIPYTPAMVILTDGEATDAVQNWLDCSNMQNTGFLNDFGHSGISFVTHNDTRGVSSDRKNSAWNQFLQETYDASGNVIGYESIASYDSVDKKFSYLLDTYTLHPEAGVSCSLQPIPAGNSLIAAQNFANQYKTSKQYMILTYLLSAAYYKQVIKHAYNCDIDWPINTISVDMPDSNQAIVAGFGDASNTATYGTKIGTNAVIMNPQVGMSDGWLEKCGYLLPDGTTCYDKYTVGDMLVYGIQGMKQLWENWQNGQEVSLCFRAIYPSINLNTAGQKNLIRAYLEDELTFDPNYDDAKNKSAFTIGPTSGYADGGWYPNPNHGSFWPVHAPEYFHIPTLAEAHADARSRGFELEPLDYNYVTKAYYVSTSDNAAQHLSEIMDEIVKAVVEPTFYPIEGLNDLSVQNAITYVDPIGQYLDVKDVDSVLLFGTLYPVQKAALYDYSVVQAANNSLGGFTEGWYDVRKDDRGNVVSITRGGSAWSDTCGFYTTTENAQRFVPTLDEGNLTVAQQHTVYTLYQLVAGDGALVNPCYGYSVVQGVSTPNVTYNPSDIRIWVEDISDYVDDNEHLITDDTYNEALYINLPVAALPLQVANIRIKPQASGEVIVTSYTTNTDNHIESSPFRAFYHVGIEDDIFAENGIDIDLTKVNQTYINEHKIGDKVYFYSNWYSKNTYVDYVTEKPYTRGNTAVTFSPSVNNRYYLAQFPELIYAIPDSELIGGNPKTSEFVVSGPMPYSTVTSVGTGDGQLDTNKWYYVVQGYYTPTGIVQKAIARKGGEFGSQLADGSIGTGAYLCWYNQTTGETLPFDTGIHPGYVFAVREQGLHVGDLAQNLVLKTPNTTQTSETVLLPIISASTDGSDSNSLIVNGYLGNNGRLAVEDTILEITKTVEPTYDMMDTSDVEFDYTVKIENTVGDHYGIALRRHTTSSGSHWDQVVERVKVITNNNGYVLAPGGELATYNGQYMYVSRGIDGNPVYATPAVAEMTEADNQVFYLNVKLVSGDPIRNPAGTDAAVTVYEAIENDGINENKHAALYDCQPEYKRFPLTFDTSNIARFTLHDGEGVLINGIHSGTSYTVTEILDHEDLVNGSRFRKVTHTSRGSDIVYNETAASSGNYSFSTPEGGPYTYTVSGTTGSAISAVRYQNYLVKVSKEELIPGVDIPVRYQEQITYGINWRNDKDTQATITITDKLDDGLKFISSETSNTYDPASNTVTWTFETGPHTYGQVQFIAEVTENAVEIVKNKATVQVDHDPAQETNEVQNPLAGDVLIVKRVSGTEAERETYFTFEIHFYDEHGEELTGSYPYEYGTTEFVAPVYSDPGLGGPGLEQLISSGGTFQLKHAQTILIKNLPAGTYYTVQEINATGYTTSSTGETGTITYMEVQEADFLNETNSPPPPGDLQKTEVTPGAGNLVFPGNEIHYQISYQNPYGIESNVTITDVLDPGLDFVSAWFNDTKLEPIKPVSSIMLHYYSGHGNPYVFDMDTEIIEADDTNEVYDVEDDASFWPGFEGPDFEGSIKPETYPSKEIFVLLYDEHNIPLNGTYKVTGCIEDTWSFGDTLTLIEGYPMEIRDLPAGTNYQIVVDNELVDEGIIEESVEKKLLAAPSGESEAPEEKEEPMRIVNSLTYVIANDTAVIDLLTQTQGNVTITYDPDTRTVTWIIRNCPGYESGFVDLTVRVNDVATPREKVVNVANVQFNHDPAKRTNVIENPVAPGNRLPATGGPGIGMLLVCGCALVMVSLIIRKKQTAQ